MDLDKTSFKLLQKVYTAAVKKKKEHFIFQERVILTRYAKYLLEYLTPKFKK